MSKSKKPKTAQLGILGGGQLALMLASAAVRLGLRPVVFSDSALSPAASVFAGSIIGSMHDAQALNNFISKVDVVIFENEFVDCDVLKEAASSFDVKFFPGLQAIQLVQDKLQQKELLQKLDIRTSDFLALNLENAINEELQRVVDEFGPCVLKWSKLGYDGKGVFFLEDSIDGLSRAKSFCKKAIALGSEVYAERFVAFARELAVIGVFSTTGELRFYPVVVSEQENGICSRVFGPARSFGLSEPNEKRVQEYVRRIAKSLNLVGAFGVEFFETSDGNILVNEIAPRVHNSGHYTQDACRIDQFENHIRAVLGYPLGCTDAARPFAMMNILGPDHGEGQLTSNLIPIPSASVHLHWYGKAAITPRRKLGHLNANFERADELQTTLAQLERVRENWVQSLKE